MNEKRSVQFVGRNCTRARTYFGRNDGKEKVDREIEKKERRKKEAIRNDSFTRRTVEDTAVQKTTYHIVLEFSRVKVTLWYRSSS